MTPDLTARLLARLDVLPRLVAALQEEDDGCWNWRGHLTPAGYGYMQQNGKKIPVHRLAYETFRGPIPDGLDLDHLCRNTRCIRPDHLEPVTRAENFKRGRDYWRGLNVDKDQCPRGHWYTPENTYVFRGSRRCRVCHREQERERRNRRRAELAPGS